MTGEPTRLGRGLLVLGLALVIAKLLVTGQMAKYMAPALDPLSALTAGVLAIMGVLELRGAFASGRAAGPAHTTEPDEGVEPSGSVIEEGLTYGLVVLILLMGFFVTPRALGSSGLGGERVSRLLLRFAPGSVRSASTAAPTPPNLLDDEIAVLAYLREAGEAGVGPRVRLAGTITRSDEFGASEFALLRYAIAHCVADARPVALFVVAPPDFDLAADQWIEVEGVLTVREREGDRLVTIEAQRIRPIEEPGNPYLSIAF